MQYKIEAKSTITHYSLLNMSFRARDPMDITDKDLVAGFGAVQRGAGGGGPCQIFSVMCVCVGGWGARDVCLRVLDPQELEASVEAIRALLTDTREN